MSVVWVSVGSQGGDAPPHARDLPRRSGGRHQDGELSHGTRERSDDAQHLRERRPAREEVRRQDDCRADDGGGPGDVGHEDGDGAMLRVV